MAVSSDTARPLKEQWAFFHGLAYWKAELDTGRTWSSLDDKIDLHPASRAMVQWYDDLVASGDVLRIRELWLYGPRSTTDPHGGTVKFTIRVPGTAFCFHGASFNVVSGQHYPTYLACGKVLDPISGVCELAVYDYLDGHLYLGMADIYDIQPWRAGVPPVGKLDMERIGLRGM